MPQTTGYQVIITISETDYSGKPLHFGSQFHRELHIAATRDDSPADVILATVRLIQGKEWNT